MDKIAFFLPTRKGSERVVNKNTRTFAGVEGGILKIKLQQYRTPRKIMSFINSY